MNLLGGLVAIGSVWGLIRVLDSKAANKRKRENIPGCKLTTQEALFLTNQAFASGNLQLIQATMHALWENGCTNEGNAISQYLFDKGVNPSVSVIPANVPMAGPGQVTLQPGDTWRAAALLGGLGCALSLATIREGVQKKGFTNVAVYSKNPGWGSQWDAESGLLECNRYIQATVVGGARAEKKPPQVYRLERISVAT